MDTILDEKCTSDGCTVFNALGDPTRYKIVEILRDSNCCVTDLSEHLGISPAGASQQLKILEKASVLIRKRDGQKICYQINREDQTIVAALKIMESKA